MVRILLVAQVRRDWNPILLELKEWLRFGKEVKNGAFGKEMALA